MSEKFNVQEFLKQASADGLINLDITLKQAVTSKSFGYLNGFADPWDWWCGSDLRHLIIWRGPRVRIEDVLIGNLRLNEGLRESLQINNTLAERLAATLGK